MARADIIYFKSVDAFRAWLKTHHLKKRELWVGMYRKHTGKPSLTWPEAVDCALAFGWIDGVRYGVDDERFKQRFTPRRPGSNWSLINIRRMRQLIKEGLASAAGVAAFEKRTKQKSGVYSFEQRRLAKFSPAMLRRFKANRAAWEFFQAQPPGYRALNTYRVMSAKRPETRDKRLDYLITMSARRTRVL